MHKSILYRGFKNSFIPGEYKNIYLERSRRPLNTPMDVHIKADNWFFNKFGYKFRSQSLFCYGSIEAASYYGEVGVIEPIGEHQLCWSPIIKDFYFQYSLFATVSTVEQILESGEYQIFSIENEELMKKAIKNGHEIMLWCKAFRIIDKHDFQEFQSPETTSLIL